MALKISLYNCVLCGACELACPNTAIYAPGSSWAFSDGTNLMEPVARLDGTIVEARQRLAPLSLDTYYIVPDKCTECQGFH